MVYKDGTQYKIVPYNRRNIPGIIQNALVSDEDAWELKKPASSISFGGDRKISFEHEGKIMHLGNQRLDIIFG